MSELTKIQKLYSKKDWYYLNNKGRNIHDKVNSNGGRFIDGVLCNNYTYYSQQLISNPLQWYRVTKRFNREDFSKTFIKW